MRHSLEGSSPKRKRLSYACNYCRLKKTRCDEQQPSCQNCKRAGIECITTDKRRAGAIVRSRRRSFALPETSSNPPNSITSSEPEMVPEPEFEPSPVRSHVPTSNDQNPLLSAPPSWRRRWARTERLPMVPRFLGSSMFDVTTGWLELAFYRLKISKTFDSPRGISGHSKARLPVVIPQFPSTDEARNYCQLYRATLHPVFPFLAEKTFESVLEFVCSQVNTLNNQQNMVDAPMQALSYLVLIVGLKTAGGSGYAGEELASSYFSHCNTLLGFLVACRCLKSVQAILLFAIIIRSYDETAWAWDILTMGVSMAQSLGINETGQQIHASDGTHVAPEDEDEKRRTWWCVYIFEKILASECGHVSTIWDSQLCGVTLTKKSDLEPSGDETYQFAAVSLANVLHELQERSARTWYREEWLPQTVEEAIQEKITLAGDLALLLQGWSESLPPGYIPGYGSSNVQERSFFLTYYYYHAIILAKRSTLLIDRAELQEKIDRYGRGKSWQSLLLNSRSLVVEAAREMIKLFVRLVDQDHPSFLMALTSPLVATYALAVHICRNPDALLGRSDFELMKVGMEITVRYYHSHSTVEDIRAFLQSLERYTMQRLSGTRNVYPTADGQPFASTSATLPSVMVGEEASLLDSSNLSGSFATQEEFSSVSLDWLGWDWNDLSHLFLRSE